MLTHFRRTAKGQKNGLARRTKVFLPSVFQEDACQETPSGRLFLTLPAIEQRGRTQGSQHWQPGLGRVTLMLGLLQNLG